MKAWHFCTTKMKLGYDDGRRIVPGKTLGVDPDRLVPCLYGLHGSKRILDALNYAPGPIACRVQLGGRVLHKVDKSVASERTCLWYFDATKVLHEFACREAEDALAVAGVTDERYFAAISAKRAWVAGNATDQQLTAAWIDARTAAWNAAASNAAAWNAASNAASWNADARTAARNAAVSNSARGHQNRRLSAMIAAGHRKNTR